MYLSRRTRSQGEHVEDSRQTGQVQQIPPVTILGAAGVFWLAVTALIVVFVSFQPWLGLMLSPGENGVSIVSVSPDGPASVSEAGDALVAIATSDSKTNIALLAFDLIEEPGYFGTYTELRTFLQRQQDIVEVLASPQIKLELLRNERTVQVEMTSGSRPLSSLPVVFWVQIIVGSGGFLIGFWVFALRSRNLPTALFALCGMSIMAFSYSAAIYSSRELALDGSIFRLLTLINIYGANMFGAVMIALFLIYPVKLVQTRLIAIPILICFVWATLDALRLLPSQAYGTSLSTLTEMVFIVILIGVQWVATRKRASDRAALRWLGMAVIIGAGLFIAGVAAPLAFGIQPFLSQGYAFISFLLVHIGLALAVARYKLFELDTWAFRILFYAFGALGLVVLDAALVLTLSLDPSFSLALALFAVGFVYLPLRDVIWRRLANRPFLEGGSLFNAVIDVAFGESAKVRSDRWTGLIRDTFGASDVVPASNVSVRKTVLRNDGLELIVPPAGGCPALSVRYPWHGRGLFSSAHIHLIDQLVQLMNHAEQGRTAYAVGASEERRRIAQDLHDDVGARLISGLHARDAEKTRDVIRDALSDVRLIVSGLNGSAVTLERALADMRHEGSERLALAGLEVNWSVEASDDSTERRLLNYAVHKALASVMRELVTNIIKHANAKQVAVSIRLSDADRIVIAVEDDGNGKSPVQSAGTTTGGSGLANIAKRIEKLGGLLSCGGGVSGTRVEFEVPLTEA